LNSSDDDAIVDGRFANATWLDEYARDGRPLLSRTIRYCAGTPTVFLEFRDVTVAERASNGTQPRAVFKGVCSKASLDTSGEGA
jgi:hypothetical protein